MAHSDAEPFLKETRPPSSGVFTIPSKQWDTTNLQFLHMVAGKEHKEFPKQAHSDPKRFPVPVEQVADLTNFVYGPMPQALTLRPQEITGCCSCERKYDVARDMFAEAVAEVEVKIPTMVCMFEAGMVGADVTLTPKQGQSGTSYKGTLKRGFCPGCCVNDLTLEWEGQPTKPHMSARGPSTMDNIKLCMCQPIWVGLRGSSDVVPQTQALYDASTIIRCQDMITLCCMHCKGCQNACCFAYDIAPRWTRPEDVRMLVAEKYDYEFSHRQLDAETTFEVAEGEVGELNILKTLSKAHKVDALFTGRLYMDVACGRPTVRFTNKSETQREILAGVDARYRGSLEHGNASEDDHLIVLAGLILHGMFTFPNKSNAPFRMSGASMYRGRLLPRAGGAVGAHDAV